MTAQSITPICVREVEDLIGVIPHLLGFYPQESLVIILMVLGRVELTARSDLSSLQHPGAVKDLLSRIWNRFPNAQAWFVVYGSVESFAWTVLRRVEAHLSPDQLCGSIYVGSNGWRSDSPFSGDESSRPISLVAAHAASQGLMTAASREDLVAQLAGPQGLSGERAETVRCGESQLLQSIPKHAWPGIITELINQSLCGETLTLSICAKLALLIKHPLARQEALLLITPERAIDHFHIWFQVVANTPEPYQAHSLGLLGLAAWVSGNGVVQSICAEKLERAFPTSGAIEIFRQLSLKIVPPSHWSELRSKLLNEDTCNNYQDIYNTKEHIC